MVVDLTLLHRSKEESDVTFPVPSVGGSQTMSDGDIMG